MPDEGDGFAFGDGEVDVAKDLFGAVVGERNVAVFDLAVEVGNGPGMCGFLDGGFCGEDDVDAFHSGKPFLDAVALSGCCSRRL